MPKIALTDAKLRGLKPAPKGQRVQIMDSVAPGLGVRVTDTGRKTFIFQGRFPGSSNPVRREIAATTLAAARDIAREWAALIKQGIDPKELERKAEEERAQARATTFEAVAGDYFRDKLARQRSGAVIEKRFRSRLLPVFAGKPLVDITDLDVLAKVVNPIKSKTPVQARQLFNDLGGFFRWAVDQRVYGLKASPTATIKISAIVGKITTRKRVLTDDELRAMWIAAGRVEYPVGPLYRGLMLTALRLREWSDTERAEWHLHGNDWQLVIPDARMKGKLAHVVPITADIREIFDSIPHKGQFLFSRDQGGAPITVGENVRKKIEDEMLVVLREIAVERGEDPEAVKLVPWVNHDIRRTVRTRLSRIKGIDLETREAVLAHVKPGMQGVYDQHDYFNEKREALEAWARVLRLIVDPSPNNVVALRA